MDALKAMKLSSSITEDGDFVIITISEIEGVEKLELPFTIDECRDIILLIAESIDCAKKFAEFQKLDNKTAN